ncbi:hypothetical protein CsSME_00002097 [Camellia sinensis var. sinensis]
MRVSLLLRCCRDLTRSSSDRTRNDLRKKLNDSMNCFTDIRQFITVEYKETVERRYYTVTGEKTDESTIDWLIATGESEMFFQKAIQEQGRGRVMETLRQNWALVTAFYRR